MSGKANDLTLVYGVVAVLSVLLVAGYLIWERQKNPKFLLLYACVAVANCGYYLQAVSGSLGCAMLANRISYLGAAYLILIMLLIIADVCGISLSKWVKAALIAVSTGAFALAASGDWLGLYYSQVSIETINGMTKLMKVYGPLHILYPVYLLSYFAMMVASVVYATVKGRITSFRHGVFLSAAALGNLGVWFVGQLVDVDFEFLSVSYVVTEVLLLLLDGMLRDYDAARLAAIENSREPELPPNMEELLATFAQRVSTLSGAEKRILDYYIEGHETADIPELAFISIHTVKKHNRSIYQKLAVASRDELMLYIELFRRCGRLSELQHHGQEKCVAFEQKEEA